MHAAMHGCSARTPAFRSNGVAPPREGNNNNNNNKDLLLLWGGYTGATTRGGYRRYRVLTK